MIKLMVLAVLLIDEIYMILLTLTAVLDCNTKGLRFQPPLETLIYRPVLINQTSTPVPISTADGSTP